VTGAGGLPAVDSLAELSWQSGAQLLQLAASLGVQLGSPGQQEMETQIQQTLLGLLNAASGGVQQEGTAPADAAVPAPAAMLPVQQAASGEPAGAAAGAGPVPLAEGVGSKSRSRSGDEP
jgi:hypothetical protein